MKIGINSNSFWDVKMVHEHFVSYVLITLSRGSALYRKGNNGSEFKKMRIYILELINNVC